MYRFRTRALAWVSTLVVVAAVPVAASVSLDFLVAFEPSDDVHVQLRATYGYFTPSQTDLRQVAGVVTSPEEMAVVFFIARHSGVSAELILQKRSRGDSWYSLMVAFGVDRHRLYLELPQDVGPPYGKAHGYHRKAGTSSQPVALTDRVVLDLVGLQVVAAYHNVDPAIVIEARKAGKGYAAIHGELSRKGGGAKGGHSSVGAKPKGNAKAKGKGKGGGNH